MIAVNFRSQNYRSACNAGHPLPEQVLNFLLQAPCICGAFQRCARTELFVCITFLFAKSGLQLHGVLSSSLPAVLLWHAWRRFVSTLLSLSNTWSRWCGKVWVYHTQIHTILYYTTKGRHKKLFFLLLVKKLRPPPLSLF